jgi:hypothetical protein
MAGIPAALDRASAVTSCGHADLNTAAARVVPSSTCWSVPIRAAAGAGPPSRSKLLTARPAAGDRERLQPTRPTSRRLLWWRACQLLSPLQHRLAGPASRPTRTERSALSRAAVTVILAPSDAILLVRRAGNGAPWSGQMACRAGDTAWAGLLVTAIVRRPKRWNPPEPHHLVGPLDDVAPRSPHLPPLWCDRMFALPERQSSPGKPRSYRSAGCL